MGLTGPRRCVHFFFGRGCLRCAGGSHGASDTFAPVRLLKLPAADMLPASRLPCETYPSDHCALLATLRLGHPV